MRSLIDVIDFSVEEINELIKTALDIQKNPDMYSQSCKGKILATLFFEPSTRTRLSFETAMLRLGGSVIGFSSASSSSASKGESVADTAKVISEYADIIAMRHYKEGAPLVASENASIPVINAGDGGHCHPTQTLADLLTIYRRYGRLSDITVGFCGDLKFGRTVHSLISALSRYTGIKIVLISPNELKLPDYVIKNVIEKSGLSYVETDSLEEYMDTLDVLYMTRVQGERFEDKQEYERLKDSYILTPDKIKNAKADMTIMHPLPRVNELSVKIDSDSRACYFMQVESGKLMRMALIIKLLKESKEKTRENRLKESGLVVDEFKCKNPACITTTEQEIVHYFKKGEDGEFRCIYCDAKV